MSTVHVESGRPDLPVGVVLLFADGFTVAAGPALDDQALASVLVDIAFTLTAGSTTPLRVPPPRDHGVFDVERDGL